MLSTGARVGIATGVGTSSFYIACHNLTISTSRSVAFVFIIVLLLATALKNRRRASPRANVPPSTLDEAPVFNKQSADMPPLPPSRLPDPEFYADPPSIGDFPRAILAINASLLVPPRLPPSTSRTDTDTAGTMRESTSRMSFVDQPPLGDGILFAPVRSLDTPFRFILLTFGIQLVFPPPGDAESPRSVVSEIH